jgi:hypothetical protein
MSRSKKKTPFCGLSKAGSEKDDKRRANRTLRRKARAGDPENAPVLRAVADVWAMAKDGKVRFDPAASRNRKLLRK